MDINTLYILLAVVLAVVVIIGLIKSDILKVKATKEGLEIEAGKKDQTDLKNIKRSDMEIKQGKNHDILMSKIEDSKIHIDKQVR